MSLSNRDRISRALDIVRDGLGSFIYRELTNYFGTSTEAEIKRLIGDDRLFAGKSFIEQDSSVLFKVMWESWNTVFKTTLGHAERALLSEIRDWRNKWAHQESFTSDDTDRALDSMERLLTAVSAPQSEEIKKMKSELRRLVFDEQLRGERRKSVSLIESTVTGALKPWREIITPHQDVASGRYQQAEFAADLWQVHMGEGSDEYRIPAEFFRRTYLTESLKWLLINGLKRIAGLGGDPVVQLQTNFGGGKTHSMLALYHLFSGSDAQSMVGLEAVLAEAGIKSIPTVKKAVLVGNKLSPGNPSVKPDGTVVRTLWGELAWQLGGKAGFERIRPDDENGTSPGDRLRELFNSVGPCLILIDEWVAYARQLHDDNNLPGGSFDTQFSFAQALTESAKTAKNCLLVMSLPSSDTAGSPHAQINEVEVGGVRGREALDRLRNVVGRLESSWRPATAEEGFEIVRRRLFEPITTPDLFVQRDVVARAFGDMYRTQSSEFPAETRTTDYERRIQAAYPIHPEVFDRLYNDWSTLVKFQRTRGVLRLMAAVIHSLWENGDRNPLILPCHIPIDDKRIQFELTRYLSDVWPPIIERDVDGPQSLPRKIDAEIPNLGKHAATRRIARTIYLGSAPITSAAHRGLEDRQVKLGCVMPGESPSHFGDALRRLASTATYLYQDGNRVWYSTQPTVTKLAEDRAEQLRREPDKLYHELENRLKVQLSDRGDFFRIHLFPRSGNDIPDEMPVRLVIVPPEHAFSREKNNLALSWCRDMLDRRGNQPRAYRNTLIFLAADSSRFQDLAESIASYLAWESITQERDALNLDPHQFRQAEEQKRRIHSTVETRVPETFQWLLVPGQRDAQSAVEWTELKLVGSESLAHRAAKKLKSDELLITAMAPSRLKMEMDKIPLWRGDHVQLKVLIEDFARFLNLPRVSAPEVIARSVTTGLALASWDRDSFAWADSYDEQKARYVALRYGTPIQLSDHQTPGLIVKATVAVRQLEQERMQPPVGQPVPGVGQPGGEPQPTPGPSPVDPGTVIKKKIRVFGSVQLDPSRTGLNASQIADELIGHLVVSPGSKVTVTLEIHAHLPEGADENLQRVLKENARSLKFTQFGFEEE